MGLLNTLKEVKSVRVNVFTREVRVTRDLIGHKEDFRVNAQYLMATATVGEELSTEQELGEQSVSLCEDETSIFLQTSLLQPNQLSPEKDKTAPAGKISITNVYSSLGLHLVTCSDIRSCQVYVLENSVSVRSCHLAQSSIKIIIFRIKSSK